MKRKISGWISALLIATSIFTVGGALKLNSQSANADTQTTVEYNFTSETQMDDFIVIRLSKAKRLLSQTAPTLNSRRIAGVIPNKKAPTRGAHLFGAVDRN